jgi:hypothetical protein
MADYRLGHFAESIEQAQQVLADAGVFPPRDAQACAVLAMAQEQMGQSADARASLARAAKIAESDFPGPADGDLGPMWNDGIIARALLLEAEALINGQPPRSADPLPPGPASSREAPK